MSTKSEKGAAAASSWIRAPAQAAEGYVTDLRALIAVAGPNAAMILFGLLMERANLGRKRLDWLPFWLGCLVGERA